MLLQLIEEMLTLIGGLIVVYFVYVLISRKDDKPSADPPTMAHTALRELVERAVDEARKLPGLTGNGNNSASAQEGRSIVEQSYEDLLATAILNKVIEKFQREQVDGNSNVLFGKSSPRTKCALSESELGLDEGVEEGSSSLEPLSQDECSSECSASRSRRTRNHQEPLSLTIEERIEEVTTTYTSDEDHRDIENEVLGIRSARRVPFPELGMDIIDPSQESSDDSQDEPDTPKAHIDMVSPIETWEENWLFQKKRAQIQSDAVAMLVPNSSADFKALIGDKDAEDTSDLSECSSAQSDDEIEKELMEAINNVVPSSPKHSDSENESFPISETENTIHTILPSAVNGVEDGIVENGKGLKNALEVSEAAQMDVGIVNQNTELVPSHLNLQGHEFANKNKSDAKDIKQEQSVELLNAAGDTEVWTDVSNGVVEKVDLEKSEKEHQRPVENSLSDQMMLIEEAATPNVPKTPTPTPTRISMTENGIAENDETCLEVEQVLNSLESAKIKLMDIDESNEYSRENDSSISMDAYQKHNFSVEDEAQQESEYTEHYDMATQRHMDSLTKVEKEVTNSEMAWYSAPSKSDSKCREAVACAKAESASIYSLKNSVDVDNQLATPPRPGTIAEREHKKWENAPPIENNPYSEESIQKRLWERQYSRRASDIPGAHAELPKSNGTELEVVLEPTQPDIKRFGRDYYINESKVASGERTRRSTASISSRPSSSLSQRSNSTTAEQEQQVSFGLEWFEEASLRGSLSRWSYRDPHASAHFAINPLLHHLDELAQDLSTDGLENSINEHCRSLTSVPNGRSVEATDAYSAESGNRLKNGTVSHFGYGDNVILLPMKDLSNDVTSNPLYELESESLDTLSPGDRDSGMDSIESNEFDGNRHKSNDGEDSKRLSWVEEDDVGKGNASQMLTVNGKKYWNIASGKYHTFGGIKVTGMRYELDELDEEQINNQDGDHEFVKDPEFSGASEFANLKFQTFGGIKKCERIDGRKISVYRIIKLRASLSNLKGFKYNNLTRNEASGNASSANRGNRNKRRYKKFWNYLEEEAANEWQDEDYSEYDFTNEDQSSRAFERSKIRKSFEKHRARHKLSAKDVPGWKLRSTKPRLKNSLEDTHLALRFDPVENEWEDQEDCCTVDEGIMTKFLDDVSRRPNSCLSTDNGSMYSLNTTKRRILSLQGDLKRTELKRSKTSLSDDGSLKLEPPVVSEVVERRFETLKDLRCSRKQKKGAASQVTGKRLGVRNLSDVTIW